MSEPQLPDNVAILNHIETKVLRKWTLVRVRTGQSRNSLTSLLNEVMGTATLVSWDEDDEDNVVLRFLLEKEIARDGRPDTQGT